ncbi:hypothetical protein D3C72_2032640 [compost metagenome]
MLSRRALAVALARHDDVDPGPPDRINADRQGVASAKSRVRVTAQLLVEVREDRHRRDLVGGDVVAQRGGLSRIGRGARQLRGHTGGILRQEQQAGRNIEYE